MNSEAKKHLKFNVIVNLLDGGFFGFALGFASFSTIIPLFVSGLTDSALLIGLIPAIHNTGWQLPQLFTARQIGRMKEIKPFVTYLTIHERLPILGLCLVALFLGNLGKDASLLLIFLMLIWQGLGGGFTANPWQVFINKVFPSDYLATFFGLQSSVANLLASGSAIAAGFILEQVPPPQNFALCFFLAGVFFFVSWFFLNSTKEMPHEVVLTEFSKQSIFTSIKEILAKDTRFRWYIIGRNLTQFGTMAFAFYIVYAVRQHGISESQAGFYTGILFITQMIANPILGWLADRWNKRRIMEIGAAAAAVSAIFAWIIPDPIIFPLVFILAGIAGTVFWTIGMAFTLSFGTEEERPTYVGMANTLIAPSAVLAPVAGGILADIWGYQATFLTAAVCSILTIVVYRIFVKG